jgi:ATP phosphoribosyltransferase regulatory subunit
MAESAESRAAAGRLLSRFEALGAKRVEADILQPAGPLLDLYGEDIRARAYVTSDPLRGEVMLRPDFTVPVVQMHLARNDGPARYTYAGEVFRKQEEETGRPSEYIQVGFEHFGAGDEAAADAEVFAAFHGILAPIGLKPATGDIGLLIAAVRGLSTTEARKQALLRHLWRPRRFRALVERFRTRRPAPVRHGSPDSPEIGLRTRDEVEARLGALADDAAAPPLSGMESEVLDALLTLKDPAASVLSQIRDIAVDFPAVAPAAEAFGARLDALSGAGIDVDALPFEASYGRTTLEYYDGFVFGFYAEGRPDLPPVATGGRYDALTGVLGGGEALPAVGGVIRPGLMAELGVAP